LSISKNVVVTGSSGFIGEHICAELQRREFSVIRVDFRVSHQADAETISPEQFLTFSKNQNYRNEISHILHFGANSNANIDNLNQIKYCNIEFTIELMNLFRNSNVFFIFSSSAAVYGNEHRMISESNRSPYAESKYLIEQLLCSPEFSGKLNYIILRLFNVYGRNELTKKKMMSIVSRFVQDALITNKMQIWSLENSKEHPPGSQSRDLLYVKDLVTFTIEIIMQEPEKYLNRTIDCGTGISMTYTALANIINGYLPARIEYVSFPDRFLVDNYQWFTKAEKDSIRTVCPDFKFTSLSETLPSLIDGIRNELQHE